MSLAYDLHCHSTASDGTVSPGALVQRASAAGIAVLALTDHDTLAGLPEAMAAAENLPIRIVAGVELSVTWGGRTIHILGLNLDPTCPALCEGLADIGAQRGLRAEAIAQRLEKLGFDGALEGARVHCHGEQIGRTHFARFLVDRGAAPDVRRLFQHFLAEGKPGYVAGQWATLAQALHWISAAGGVAVIAHPARYGFTRSKLKRLIGEFRDGGGIGIEVLSGSHSRDDAFVFARHAREARLLASAGSDYHGPDSPWIELGRLPELPEGCRPIWTWPGFPRIPAAFDTADTTITAPCRTASAGALACL